MRILLFLFALALVQYPTKAEDTAKNERLVKQLPAGTIAAVRTDNNYGTDQPIWVCTDKNLKVETAKNGAKICVKK